MNADSYKKQTRDRPLFTFQSNIVKQDNEHKPKARQRVLFGLIKPNEKEFLSSISTRKTKEEAKQQKRKGKRLGTKKRRREGVYNQGRWTVEEHRRFIEALLKYGNDWKNVQKHVSTRTSTQARSHAQKFFVKIGQIKIDDLQLDFTNNSLKSLNMMANNFSADQLEETLKALNKINFAKRVSNRKDSGPSISSGDGFDFHAITSLKK